MSVIEDRLLTLGIVLPQPSAPVANYVPAVVAGNLLVISGQLALDVNGKLPAEFTGKVGADVSPETAKAAARQCAINVLAQAKGALGSLERIERCIRLGGFFNTAPGFAAIAPLMNGASDVIVDVLGDEGRHARSTIGVAEVPLGSAVEVEAMFLLKAE
ncbi:MAG: RidA family protein [Beijerinckiaceae bacterium]